MFFLARLIYLHIRTMCFFKDLDKRGSDLELNLRGKSMKRRNVTSATQLDLQQQHYQQRNVWFTPAHNAGDFPTHNLTFHGINIAELPKEKNSNNPSISDEKGTTTKIINEKTNFTMKIRDIGGNGSDTTTNTPILDEDDFGANVFSDMPEHGIMPNNDIVGATTKIQEDSRRIFTSVGPQGIFAMESLPGIVQVDMQDSLMKSTLRRRSSVQFVSEIPIQPASMEETQQHPKETTISGNISTFSTGISSSKLNCCLFLF